MDAEFEGVPVSATDELRERLAKALHEAQCGCPTWVVKDLEDTQYDDMAAALLPLVVAVVAEARTEGAIAELEAAANSKHSVTTVVTASTVAPPEYAVSERFDFNQSERARLLARAAALRGVGNQKVGVTVDDLALDEMDGNQNAEPRWSANRLEEVLREGLPDQNAEPETGPAEWGIAWSADHIDTATSWGADEAGARHRVSKYRDYVLVKRLYGQGDDAWLPADQKGTEQ